MKIGNKEYTELIVVDRERNLIASITDKDIIEYKRNKVILTPVEKALAELVRAKVELYIEKRPLEELCKPIIEYIKENYNPHTEVVVTMDGITVKQDIEEIPSKERS